MKATVRGLLFDSCWRLLVFMGMRFVEHAKSAARNKGFVFFQECCWGALYCGGQGVLQGLKPNLCVKTWRLKRLSATISGRYMGHWEERLLCSLASLKPGHYM
jgi:hypothetical protein